MSWSVDSRDSRVLYRLGNKTTTAVDEVLVCNRAYVEQSSQAQRSIKSSSAQDGVGGSGAKKVRITYLTSAYELKTEDVTMNGTSAVNTVASDIRFIENLEVIEGAAAVGAVTLWTTTGGGGSEFAGIGVGTYEMMVAHHYVPAGKSAWIIGWGATCNDDVSFKLLGREVFSSLLVDRHIDLDNLTGLTAGTRADFYRELLGAACPEKAYIRITAVPGQTGSTIFRARLFIWEE